MTIPADFPDVTGAIVRSRWTLTEEQARTFDRRRHEQDLYDAGAHKVTVETHIVCESRARVAEATVGTDDMALLELWFDAENVPEDKREGVRAILADILEREQDTAVAGAGAIRPTRLRLRNIGLFADLDLPIPEGITAVVGPNGAGKSTWLGAIDAGLFAERGEVAALTTFGEDGCELLLEFVRGDEAFRVRRQAGRRGTTLDFEREVAT